MKAKPILLPTAREPFKMPYHKTIPKSNLVLGLVDSYRYSKGLGLTKDRGTIGNFSKEMYQNIYLIDETAEIRDADWYIVLVNELMEIHQRGKKDKSGIRFIEGNSWIKGCKKIISSTDPSLGLPLLSEQSIKLLIDYYNKNGKMLESVNIEEDLIPTLMEGRRWDDKEASKPDGNRSFYMKSEIKLNSRGTIDISISEKKMYSKEEVEEIIINSNRSILELYANDTDVDENDLFEMSFKWIKENLK